MCTVSWLQNHDETLVFFNRDEQRSRSLAKPPAVRSPDTGGEAFLAPIDPQGGGTWLMANRFGFLGALLNAYDVGRSAVNSPANLQSRGSILVKLAGMGSLNTMEDELRKIVGSANYAPFYLFGFQLQSTPRLLLWDGFRLTAPPQPKIPFFTTSSIRSSAIRAHRENCYRQQCGEAERACGASLEALHRSFDPQDGARSILMVRPDARTVSITRARINRGGVSMDYWPVREHPPTPEVPETAELPGNGMKTPETGTSSPSTITF